MIEEDMIVVAEAITAALENWQSDDVLEEIREEVEEFARSFPLFAW
jgi:glycine hydroxymethyltransferase